MRTAFAETLLDLMATDPAIWLVTGDLGFSVLEPFIERFPERYVNAGVAEQNMTGVAAGLASCGHTVFTYSIANFPTIRCLEQVRNDVCYNGLNVKIVSVGGGFAYGPQGYTHHGLEDLAVMRALPGMTVVAPGDPVETRLATRAIAALPGPCYLRLGKAREPIVHTTPPAFELGRAIEIRPGRTLTLIGAGGILAHVVAVADRLHREAGIDARVLSMHTIKPLDERAIAAAACETGAILTVEEHSIVGGLGSAVADLIATGGLACRFAKWGASDRLLHAVGSQDYLRGLCGDLFTAARDLVSRK